MWHLICCSFVAREASAADGGSEGTYLSSDPGSARRPGPDWPTENWKNWPRVSAGEHPGAATCTHSYYTGNYICVSIVHKSYATLTCISSSAKVVVTIQWIRLKSVHTRGTRASILSCLSVFQCLLHPIQISDSFAKWMCIHLAFGIQDIQRGLTKLNPLLNTTNFRSQL